MWSTIVQASSQVSLADTFCIDQEPCQLNCDRVLDKLEIMALAASAHLA